VRVRARIVIGLVVVARIVRISSRVRVVPPGHAAEVPSVPASEADDARKVVPGHARGTSPLGSPGVPVAQGAARVVAAPSARRRSRRRGVVRVPWRRAVGDEVPAPPAPETHGIGASAVIVARLRAEGAGGAARPRTRPRQMARPAASVAFRTARAIAKTEDLGVKVVIAEEIAAGGGRGGGR